MTSDDFLVKMKYHRPTEEGLAALQEVRRQIEQLGVFMCRVIPPSAERTIALRSLLDARMKCNAAMMLSGEEMGVPER